MISIILVSGFGQQAYGSATPARAAYKMGNQYNEQHLCHVAQGIPDNAIIHQLDWLSLIFLLQKNGNSIP